MIARITFIDGNIQISQPSDFILTPADKMRPDILKAEVFTDNGKRINCVRRKLEKKRKPEKILQEIDTSNANSLY